MICSSTVPERHAPAEIRPSSEEVFHIRKGQFDAVIEKHQSHFKFALRDLRRSRPTIHGFARDFADAARNVAQLLNALTRRAQTLAAPNAGIQIWLVET